LIQVQQKLLWSQSVLLFILWLV